MKNTKTNQVLKFMQSGKPITKFKGFNEFDVTNLGDLVLRLRRKGYNIITVMVKNKDSRFAKYILNGK